MHNEIKFSVSHEWTGPDKNDYKYFVKAEVIDRWGEHFSTVHETVEKAVAGLINIMNDDYNSYRKVT